MRDLIDYSQSIATLLAYVLAAWVLLMALIYCIAKFFNEFLGAYRDAKDEDRQHRTMPEPKPEPKAEPSSTYTSKHEHEPHDDAATQPAE